MPTNHTTPAPANTDSLPQMDHVLLKTATLLRANPDDVVFLEFDGVITPEVAQRLQDIIKEAFGSTRVVITDQPVSIKVLTKEEADGHGTASGHSGTGQPPPMDPGSESSTPGT